MPSNTVVFRNVTKIYGANSSIERFRTVMSKLKAGNLTGHMERSIGTMTLKNISFSVQKGEKVGIIGPNGAGKSTILKLINNVIDPTNGSVEVNGSVGGLIEVGAGFQPNLSCRENVILNLTFQGFSTKEAVNNVDTVFALAELPNFKDAIFKNLSSGMRVRLGFVTALISQPDIVLLDEVLAVGDHRFKVRSKNLLDQYLEDKTTFFVSHSMEQIRDVCDRVIVVSDNRILHDGEVEAGIAAYYDAQQKNTLRDDNIIQKGAHGVFLRPAAEIVDLKFFVTGRITTEIPKDIWPECALELKYNRPSENGLCLEISLKKLESSGYIATLVERKIALTGSESVFRWMFNSSPLLPGEYYFEASFGTEKVRSNEKKVVRKFPFSVTSKIKFADKGLLDLGINPIPKSKETDDVRSTVDWDAPHF